MPVKLKICGVTSLEDALIAAQLGADWLGFNFCPASPRYIAPELAAGIIKALPQTVESVGVMVKPFLEEARKIIAITGVRRLQIYEPQDFNDFSQLGVPVIVCYRCKNGKIAELNYASADMVLLDNYAKSIFGGTGKAFDWQCIPAQLDRKRLVLAGGINTTNISEALEMIGPAVIDVASGSETEPGRKDPEKIKTLVTQIRIFNQRKEN
ncbi:MAG TPA: phosphoribosylanthranilate isomerase [Candidatus Marinimicrobia bacterium]|nr:phosphoribosylanthranilate isomerase [Candidatus Neomarinimicrobiota bacterium]HRS50952.1 phosphoribosylanthranilate isomerase [Candidatus Neomarinimicrobiota bacterium]HRU91706.1 phosphoribosylanthranilate isomerase [Candidatus Neomarinimicrobiota bacterium]